MVDVGLRQWFEHVDMGAWGARNWVVLLTEHIGVVDFADMLAIEMVLAKAGCMIGID